MNITFTMSTPFIHFCRTPLHIANEVVERSAEARGREASSFLLPFSCVVIKIVNCKIQRSRNSYFRWLG